MRILICLLFLSVLLSGCAPSETLGRLDRKAGEMFFDGSSTASTSDAAVNDNPDAEKNSEPVDWRMLSQEQKKAIDEWLAENNLNRYGDQKDVMYASGTPLFDEISGEARDRYEYILEKLPDILNKTK